MVDSYLKYISGILGPDSHCQGGGMNRLRILLILVPAISLLTTCPASGTGLEAAVGVWNQDPRGYLSYNEQNPVTDRLSVENDLRYGNETKIFGRIKIETPFAFPNIYLMATPMSFEATGIKNTPFTFGATVFSATIPFTSKLTLDHYDVGLYYGLPFLKSATTGIVNIDLGVLARFIDFTAEVSQISAGTEAKRTFLALPMVYAAAQVKPLSWIAAECELRGILYGHDHYYDIIGRAKIKPFGPVFLAAGYRYEKLKIDEEGIKAETNVGGPFGEAGVEF
jgi:outer membrane protein